MTDALTLIDASDDTATGVEWINVDDPVMGGLSTSQTEVVEEPELGPLLRFHGEVSLENNGGFCSTRTEGATWEAPGASAFSVRLRGDGKRYAFTVRTEDHSSGSYRYRFDTSEGSVTSLEMSIDAFELYRRGTHIADAPTLDPATIRSVGFLITDAQAGSFLLDILSIQAPGA